MALHPFLSQIIIAIKVGLRCRIQRQGIWWIDLGMAGLLLVDQPVQEVQDVRFVSDISATASSFRQLIADKLDRQRSTSWSQPPRVHSRA